MSVALEPSAIRARRRPGLVAILYLHRLVASVVVAAPVAATVSLIVSRDPRGDLLLWQPGGVWLLEVARLLRTSAMAFAAVGGVAALLAAAVGLVPLAVLLAGLGRRGPLSLAWLLGRAGAHLGTLATLFGLALAAQGLVLAIVVLATESVAMTMQARPAVDVLRAVGWALALALVAAAGVVHDLARAAAVGADCDLYAALTRAVDVAAAAPVRLLAAYAWRGALSLCALALAAWLAARVGVATRGALVTTAVVHQAGVVLAVALRASWLAAALRAVVPAAASADRDEVDGLAAPSGDLAEQAEGRGPPRPVA